jgi:hypothetical protein
MEEHRLTLFENRVPRRIFGPRTDEVTEGYEVKKDEMDMACSTNGRRGMHRVYWWECKLTNTTRKTKIYKGV